MLLLLVCVTSVGTIFGALGCVMLSSEIGRLKRGEFTPEEMQELCHNLTSADYRQFCDGCTAYQRKLFNGRSREDDLKSETVGNI